MLGPYQLHEARPSPAMPGLVLGPHQRGTGTRNTQINNIDCSNCKNRQDDKTTDISLSTLQLVFAIQGTNLSSHYAQSKEEVHV